MSYVQEKDRELLWNINQKYLYEMTKFYDDLMDEKRTGHMSLMTREDWTNSEK